MAEQVYFFGVLKNKNNLESQEIKSFIKKYDKDGLKSFLSLAHGGKEMEQKILSIGKSAPENLVKNIFQKYAEMVDATHNVEEYIQENFKQQSNIDVVKIKESLLLRGVSFLNNLHENVQNSHEGMDLSRVEQTLNNIHRHQ